MRILKYIYIDKKNHTRTIDKPSPLFNTEHHNHFYEIANSNNYEIKQILHLKSKISSNIFSNDLFLIV